MQATKSISGRKGTLFVETDVIYYRRRNHLKLQPTTMTLRQTSFKPSDDNTSRPTTTSRYGRPLRASFKYADVNMS